MLGGAQPGNRFVSFMHVYTRSGCLVELDHKFRGPVFSLFPVGSGRLVMGFSFLVLGGLWELSLFPFGRGSLLFSFPPTPKPSI